MIVYCDRHECAYIEQERCTADYIEVEYLACKT